MTRLLLLYILLLFAPLAIHAQAGADTIIYEDPPVAEEFTEAEAASPKYTQEAPPPAVYVNRQFKANLNKKYTGNDFKYKAEKQEQGWATRFFAWIRKVMHDLFGNPRKKDATTSKSNNSVIYKLLAIVIILGVVYFIARTILEKNGIWIFGRANKKINANDLEAENIHEMDFASLIEKTRNEADYRLALRYYYLWLLKKMSAREIISWNWDKTNTDYYYEIKDNNLRDDFKYLSYLYDHSWYGEFEVDEKAFGKAEKAFKKTINLL